MALKLSRLLSSRMTLPLSSPSFASAFPTIFSQSVSNQDSISVLPTVVSRHFSSTWKNSFHYSSPWKTKLTDFFDDQQNWGKESVRAGRPWKVEELRIKSNEELHKLWYLLLKEVNMLLTMEEEYRRLLVRFPNPERLDKCDESMEHILQVIKERNEAYHMLETGHKGEPKKEWRHDILGRPFVYTRKEHLIPEHLNTEHKPNPMGYPRDNEFWLWVSREQDLREEKFWENIELKHQRKLKDIWPENEVLKDVPDPDPKKEDFTAGEQPSGTSQLGYYPLDFKRE